MKLISLETDRIETGGHCLKSENKPKQMPLVGTEVSNYCFHKTLNKLPTCCPVRIGVKQKK